MHVTLYSLKHKIDVYLYSQGLYKSVMTFFPIPTGLPISNSLAQWLR
jgi:hypothetical protein